MIIGVCGLTGTGATAITDYLSGFNEITVLDGFEFTIAHSPDGLEDLDYQLNKHCSKYTSSYVAITRFQRCSYNYLIRLVNDKTKRRKLKKLTDEFVESISQVTWKGFGIASIQLYKNRFTMMPYIYAMNAMKRLPIRFNREWTLFPSHTMRFSIKPDDFNNKAKKYISDVLDILECDKDKIIVLDQPFAGNKPETSFPYFDNPYAIVVDRDPRDLYVFTKEFFHKNGVVYQVPSDNVDNFIAYYKNLRIDWPLKDEHVLTINFEDMIYQYEETTNKIKSFLGIDFELNGSKFDPMKSIHNTQVFKKYPQYKDDVLKIENELNEYLYPFDKYDIVVEDGKMFDPQMKS